MKKKVLYIEHAAKTPTNMVHINVALCAHFKFQHAHKKVTPRSEEEPLMVYQHICWEYREYYTYW